MLNQYIQLKDSVQEEILNKYQNSKYISKMKEIFEISSEILLNYYARCMKFIDSSIKT